MKNDRIFFLSCKCIVAQKKTAAFYINSNGFNSAWDNFCNSMTYASSRLPLDLCLIPIRKLADHSRTHHNPSRLPHRRGLRQSLPGCHASQAFHHHGFNDFHHRLSTRHLFSPPWFFLNSHRFCINMSTSAHLSLGLLNSNDSRRLKDFINFKNRRLHQAIKTSVRKQKLYLLRSKKRHPITE
jgi:hypothetical protein